MFGAMWMCLGACAFESHVIPGDDEGAPPIAGDDMLGTTANTPGTADLLANDRDPDNDALSVLSFTMPLHGSVAVASGIATYTPDASYIGDDSFQYTIDDGRGHSAGATVSVLVAPGPPGCTITLAGPAEGTFGLSVRLTATAACNTGPAEVQWYHKVNSAFVVAQPYSTSQTLDFTADLVGSKLFRAQVRTQGTTPAQAMSNVVTVRVADNVVPCTAVRMVSPVSAQDVAVNTPQLLTASATCPAGAVPEYQFWVKPGGPGAYQILPGYTTGSGTWVPPSTGPWAIKAVARSVGAHVNYQADSMSVTVDVID
jgi:hypothetical protein